MSAVVVGMGEIKTLRERGVLQCLGLGSCIGLVAYDPETAFAGLIHMMLPEAKGAPGEVKAKFCDTGCELLLETMRQGGSRPNRMQFCYVGGASVFRFGASASSTLNVGQRNIEMVEAMCRKLGIRPLATDVGGTQGRTLLVSVDSGSVTIRTATCREQALCNLKESRRLVA